MKPRCLLLFSALLILASPVARAEPVTPRPAPAWKLTDLNGNVVDSAQLKGKVVVVDFWATWCAPCRQELPGYVDLQKKYGQDGLVVVGMSIDNQGPAFVKKFVDKYSISYLIVMASDEVTKAFGGADNIPTTLIIDREGQIRDRKVGLESKQAFEKTLLTYLRPTAAL